MKNLESSFTKETSAMEKNRKKSELLTKAVQNQEKQVSELEKGLKASKEKFGENSTETLKWKQAVNNAKSELNRLKSELDKIPGRLGSMGQQLVDSGNKMEEVGKKLTDSITTPLLNVGTKSIEAFGEVNEGLQTIITKTGATGENLESLERSMRNIATSIPTDFATAGQAIGEVNTRFGLTGEKLEDLTTRFIKFAKLNNTDVSTAVDNIDKVLKAFGEDAEDAGDLLDVLNGVAQDTGISVDKLQTSLINNANALYDMGMDSKQAAIFLGQVESSGANVDTVMQGLKKATAKASKEGKTLNDVLSDFDDVMVSSKSDQEKLTYAIELFGTKAGPAIYQAYKTGSLSFKKLDDDASKYIGNVSKTFETQKTPLDDFKVALNNVKDAGFTLGSSILTTLSPVINDLAGVAQKVSDAFDKMPDSAKSVLTVGGLVALGIGPAISIIGRLETGIGNAMLALDNLSNGTGSISALAGPLAIGIAAVAGFSAALYTAFDYFTGVDEKAAEINGRLSTANEELTKSTDTLRQTLEDAQKNIDDVAAKDDAAQPMIDELYDLEAVTDKTAAQQERMRALVAQLNEMFPDLALSIDKSTGALNKSKKEVKAYIEQSKHLALAKAYAEGAQEAIKEIANASVELEKAKKERDELWEEILAYGEERGYKWNGSEWLNSLGFRDDLAFEGMMAELDKLDAKITESDEVILNAQDSYKLWTENSEKEAAAAEKSAKAVAKSTEEKKKAETQEEKNINFLRQLTAATEEATDEEGEFTESLDENTESAKKNGSAVKEAAAKAIQILADEAKAWGDSYKSAKSAIDSKIGMFGNWKVEMERTGEEILADMKQQNQDLADYADNLAYIEKMAMESGNEYGKAYVEGLRKTGLDGADEVAAIRKSLENGSIDINDIISTWGEGDALASNLAKQSADAEVVIKRNFLGISTSANGALAEIGGAEVSETVGKGVGKLIGMVEKKWTGMQKDTEKSTGGWADRVTRQINGIDPKPTLRSIAYEEATESTKSGIQTGLAKLVGNVVGINHKGAQETAQKQINYALSNLTATVISISTKTATTNAKNWVQEELGKLKGAVVSIATENAAESAKKNAMQALSAIPASTYISINQQSILSVFNAVQTFFSNNAIKVKGVLSNIGNFLGFANGGIVKTQQVAAVAEGNKPEAIIPLSTEKRERALDLYQKTGEILGVNKAASVGYSTSMTLPGTSGSRSDAIHVQFDAEQLYAAVAAGAERGMENANIRIYWDNREAGRIMKDMGVQFA